MMQPMVHHIVLYKLREDINEQDVEEMMMQTRMQLLKIPVVLNVRCGKPIAADCEWKFFMSCDFETMEKLSIFNEDPIYLKYAEEVIKPRISESLAMDFEMEPGKDVRYS